jgi:hypothetical protein
MPYNIVHQGDMVVATVTVRRKGGYLKRTESSGEMVVIKRGEKLPALADELGGNVPVSKKAPSGKMVMVWLFWGEWEPETAN